MPRAEAFAELRRCAGTQFDPDLVERFIERLESIARGCGPGAQDDPAQDVVGVRVRLSDRSTLRYKIQKLRRVPARRSHSCRAAEAEIVHRSSSLCGG